MRADYDAGMKPRQIWEKYAPNKAYSTIYNIINLKTKEDADHETNQRQL